MAGGCVCSAHPVTAVIEAINMTVTSKDTGRDIEWTGNYWIYSDTKKKVTGVRSCPKCNHKPVGVRVKIPADLSHTNKVLWKVAGIDYCIAPIVEALQKAGIDMRGSCCGHGENDGNILLQDGRVLIIKQVENKQW